MRQNFIFGVIQGYVLLLISFPFFLPEKSYAVPAFPGLFELKQPSGYKFEARKRGDEWYNWTETKDGYGIYKNTATGNWEYYIPSDNAAEKESKFRIGRKQDSEKRAIVGEIDPASSSIPKGLRPARKDESRPRKADTKPEISPQVTPHPSPLPQENRGSFLPQEKRECRLNEAECTQQKKSSTSTAVSGTIPLLVICVEYADAPHTYPVERIQSLIFGATNSVSDYYNETSYSSVTINTAVESNGTPNDGFIGWLRLRGNHPNPPYTGYDDRLIAEEAIKAADAYIDYASYDINNDGFIEQAELSIMIVVAGYEASYGSEEPAVWAHQWSIDLALDGKTIEYYAMFGEKHSDHLATIGVMCHELGHLMFTLPDLYDTDYSSRGIGDFDLMGSGGWGAADEAYAGSSPTHLSAWSKEYLGWGTVNTISSSQIISIPMADGNSSSIFRINTPDSNQYFLIENRELSGYDIGFQRSIGRDGHGGLVIYHIDKLTIDLWLDSNTVNNDENDKGVDVEEANEGKIGYEMLNDSFDDSDTNMFFFSGSNSDFTDYTIPASSLKNGNSTGISLKDISTYGNIMTAKVTLTTLKNRLPVVITGSAISEFSTSALLYGTVSANGLLTTAWFEYGTISNSYSANSSTGTVSGMAYKNISIPIFNLSGGTTYYYRLVGENEEGVSFGNESSFTTATLTVSFIPRISDGDDYSLALDQYGFLWGWGYNGTGELGDGTTVQRATPTQINSLSGVIAVDAGSEYSIALKYNGTLWAWGGYDFDEEDNVIYECIPRQIGELNDVVAVSAGSGNGFALKSDGTVWAWGDNDWGKLGDGDGTDDYKGIPVQVSNLNDAVSVVAGFAHSLALKSDGTVWAWGYNKDGQLGDGTYEDRDTPTKVMNLTKVVSISTCLWHNLALKSDGTVWAWGDNWLGQLGDGTYEDKNIPVQVNNLSDVIAIAVGGYHNLALKSDGTIWAWGDGDLYKLGNGSLRSETTPVQIDISDVTAIIAGSSHSHAIKSDGTVWSWGSNWFGQLGSGPPFECGIPTPSQIMGMNMGKTFRDRDNIPPAGAVVINDDYLYTKSKVLTLNLMAVDAVGVEGYYISTDNTVPSLSDTQWTLISPTTFFTNEISYAVDGGEGTRTVNVWYKDKTGNISGKVTDSIIIYTTCKKATSVLANPETPTLKIGQISTVTVTAIGDKGECAMEGETVKAKVKSRDKKYITVSPNNAKTDENGQATFVIKANNITGNYTITFKNGNLKTRVNVKVIK